MRTRTDIANCGAGPCAPSSISRSRGERIITEREASAGPSLTIRRPMRKLLGLVAPGLVRPTPLLAPPPRPQAVVVVKPARVFDGETMHEGWAVRVRGDRIDAVGPD